MAQIQGAGENAAASSFINSWRAPFTPSILIPLVPSKRVQEGVPDWLSLSASSISRLSGRLQFVPHVLVASEDGGRALRGRQGTLAVY